MDPVKLEARRKAKKEALELARIESEKNQKPIKSITINIEWKRSQMWGSNPNCTAEVSFQDGTFERSPVYKASGCGYDKESTVIAEVFNSYLKYKLWEFTEFNGLLKHPVKNQYYKKEEIPYGIYLPFTGFTWVSFNGGIGTSCYNSISEFIGGKFEHVASGKTFDVFKYSEV